MEELKRLRGFSGLDSVWEVDKVVEKLGDTQAIENLISIINEYDNVKKLMEDYKEIYNRIHNKVTGLQDINEATAIKEKFENVLETVIEVNTSLEEGVLTSTKAGIMSALTKYKLNLKSLYTDIGNAKILDYFTMDEPLATFKDLDGNEFCIYMDLESTIHIHPDQNYDHDIKVHLKRNNDITKIAYINVNYEGFDSYDYSDNRATNSIEAEITPWIDNFNEDVKSVIGGIIASMKNKIQALKKFDSSESISFS